MKKSKRSMAGLPVAAAQLDARPDTVDFRDLMYEPTLVEVPSRITLTQYQSSYPKQTVPILDQGQEGACTGFGLAAVAHFLLRRRRVVPDKTPVSPRMFYEMAQRYDEWPGEAYSGSSARGAMKGWHKHGVCAEELWPYDVAQPGGTLTHERASDGAQRPLGMERGILRDPVFKTPSEKEIKQSNPSSVPLFGLPNATWLRSPNGLPEGGPDASHARHHGDFDDDLATVKATLARILGVGAVQADINFSSSAAARGDCRRQINAANR